MRTASGVIALVCIIVTLAKYPARILHLKQADRFLMQKHKYTAFLFLLAALVHLGTAVPVWKRVSFGIGASGILALAAGLMLTTVCHMMKDRKREILFHRGFSLLITGSLIAHLILQFIIENGGR